MTDVERFVSWVVVAVCFLVVGAVIVRELFEEFVATR